MEGLTNAKIKNTTCKPLRLTGKPAGLFRFMRIFPECFLKVGSISSRSRSPMCLDFDERLRYLERGFQ
jgi:hypothetical protein